MPGVGDVSLGEMGRGWDQGDGMCCCFFRFFVDGGWDVLFCFVNCVFHVSFCFCGLKVKKVDWLGLLFLLLRLQKGKNCWMDEF